MKTMKLFATFILTLAVLLAQTGSAFAQEPVTNTVTALACGTDGTTVIVTYDNGDATTPEAMVEVSLGDAVTLGLIASGVECSTEALADGVGATFDPTALPPVEEEPQHPVGAVLALFFSDYADYDAIMEAHEDGTGFGVIAQALWMTKQMEGDADLFTEVLAAKESGDYSNFVLEDGSTPQNWGQLKKALLNKDEKNNLGTIMSDKDSDEEKTNNGNGPDKEKSNNGKGPDKDKDKGKDKDKKKD